MKKKNNPKPAENHTSQALGAILNEISVQEQTRTDNRLLLAARIDDARKAKGMTQQDFAKAMGQHASVVSKWLSGTHNFTADTLWDIEEKLGVELIAVTERGWKVTRVEKYTIVVQSTGLFTRGFVTPYTVAEEENVLDTKPYKYG